MFARIPSNREIFQMICWFSVFFAHFTLIEVRLACLLGCSGAAWILPSVAAYP